MKAIFFEKHGGPEVFKFAELPDPEAKVGQVLVKVKAVALNHLDIWVRRGWEGLRLEMPHITGSDVAGEVVSAPGNPSLLPGTKVIINPGIITADDEFTRRGLDSVSPSYQILGEQVRGGLAELVVVPATNVFRMPEQMSFEDAAAPLLVGLTAWRMLVKRAQLLAGESILVVGAGGGVNSLAIQIAKVMGAHVYALAGGADKAKRAKALGADEVIDYTAYSNWHAEILKMTKGRGVDVVIDNVGAHTIGKSFRAVARGGRVVTVGNTSGYDVQFDNRLIFAKQISYIGSTMGSRQDFIDAMNFLWKQGIKSQIDQVAPLADGIKMLTRLEEGAQFGKIVLRT